VIILVSSGYHLYREYLLKFVASAADVWLFLGSEPSWEKKYIIGHTVVDTLDSARMISAARDLAQQLPVRGVLCWDEVRVVQSARVAEALGLPGGDPGAVGRCRDKHQTRASLAAARVPQATSTLVASLAEARHAAEQTGYPVIVKPRALGASFGVTLVNSAAEFDAAYRHAREATEEGVPYFEAGVLIEEFLSGPEISVDSAIVNDVLTPMFVARKITGFDPHFEEIGHVVDAGDPLLRNPDLVEVLERAHHAVGFSNGITHTEVRLTTRGPKIIEINARLGGDLIPYVGFVATGIDPGRVAVRVACGQQPEISRSQQRVAAVHFFYPDRNITVDTVEVAEERLPTCVDILGTLAQPGQELVLPPEGHVTSRFAYVVVVGESSAECLAAAKSVRRAVTLRAEHSPAFEMAGRRQVSDQPTRRLERRTNGF
jgi:biotin carboxylase